MDIKQIQEALANVNVRAGKEAQETISGLLSQAVKQGAMPKTALQIDDDTMEGIYYQAYNLYNQGRYQDATHIFRLLLMLDYTAPKYSLGMAACMHRMKDYFNAICVYFVAGTLEPNNPLPYYHASDCFLKLGEFNGAYYALQLAIEEAGDQEKYKVIKERSEIMRKSLVKKMKGQKPEAKATDKKKAKK